MINEFLIFCIFKTVRNYLTKKIDDQKYNNKEITIQDKTKKKV